MDQLTELLCRYVPTRTFRELVTTLPVDRLSLTQQELLPQLPLAALLGVVGKISHQNDPIRSIISLSSLKSVEELHHRPTWLAVSDLHSLESLSELVAEHDWLRPIGPSLETILATAQKQSVPPATFLKQLRKAGLRELRSGPRTGFERTALEQDLALTLTLDISSLIDHLHLASGPKEEGEKSEDTSLLLARLSAEILELREELVGFNNWRCDFSLAREDARRLTLQIPIAVTFARAMCIARLLLPPEISLDVPPALLGKHLSRLLAHLGVSSPGFGALNLRTSEELGIPLIHEFEKEGA